MPANRWTDHATRLPDAFRSLTANQRLAATGGLVIAGSMLLPWYGLEISGGIVKTGFGAFGWGEAALLLTVGAALALLYERTRGRVLPTPLHEGTLLVASGAWSAVLIVYLMLDRPSFRLEGLDRTYNLRYGIFVALGGAVVMCVAGLRRRRIEIRRQRRRGRPPSPYSAPGG